MAWVPPLLQRNIMQPYYENRVQDHDYWVSRYKRWGVEVGSDPESKITRVEGLRDMAAEISGVLRQGRMPEPSLMRKYYVTLGIIDSGYISWLKYYAEDLDKVLKRQGRGEVGFVLWWQIKEINRMQHLMPASQEESIEMLTTRQVQLRGKLRLLRGVV